MTTDPCTEAALTHTRPPRPLIPLLLLMACLATVLTACRGDAPAHTTRFETFGAAADLTIVGIDRHLAEEVSQRIRRELDVLDRVSWTPGGGSLARVNQLLPSGEPFIAPPAIRPLVAKSQRLAEQSGHLFNPAAGFLTDIWGFDRDPPRGPPPDPATIRQYLEHAPTMADVRIEGLEMVGTNPTTQLDFGGIARGHAIDLAIESLREAGIRHAQLRIGDGVRAIGDRTGRPWRIAIRRAGGGGVFGIVELRGDESLFTAGDHQRTYLHGGRVYHHILDPRTGSPAHGVRAVTVIHSEAATADAAAHALFIAGPEGWWSVAAAMGVDQVVVFDGAGRVQMTPAMAARLEPLDGRQPILVSPPLTAVGKEQGSGTR
ncbi:FAD:protein FMN transferase [Thioalkalicoccus limnaeus]|uniref:FAD:protein FMN transferase n=1 Tax=Thioalkalicoccus limnaeus TaxID=120681 RepID=A0ABV4BAJ8_9GAMM